MKFHDMQPLSDPQSKALRLKSVRSLAGLSRKQIELSFGISENTLRMWEQPKGNSRGLTKKGAKRMVEALGNAGIVCTIEWLLSGTGQAPMHYQQLKERVIEPLSKIIHTPDVAYHQEETLIVHEIELFEKSYPNAVVFRIHDDAMEPFISYGDFVGGYQKPGLSLTDLQDEICIVKLVNDVTLCRKLLKKQDQWGVEKINKLSSSKKNIVYPAEIDYAYAVSWIRKMYLS